MKSNKKLILTLLALSTSALATDNLLKQNVESIQQGTFAGDNYSKAIICNEARLRPQLELEPIPLNNTNSVVIDSEAIHKQYLKSQKSFDRNMEIYDITSRTIKYGFGKLADIPIPGANLLTDGLNEFVSYALDKGAEQAKEDGIKNMEKIILSELKMMEQNGEVELEQLSGMSAKEIDIKFFGKHKSFDKRFEEVKVEHKPVVNALKIEALEHMVRVGEIQSRIRDAELAEGIDKNSKAISDVANSLGEFVNKTEKSLTTLRDAQERLKDSIQKVSSKVKKNTNDIAENKSHIAFLEEFMFSKMSPEEQLQALENDLYFVSDADKEIAKAKIEAVKAKQDIITGISDYLKGAGEVINIANNLGIKDPIINDVAKAINYGNQGLDVAMNVMSGSPMGYLQAASTVSGMLGGGKKSAEDAKHKQIVGMLSSLLKGQAEIKNKLNLIHKDIGKVLEGLVTISNQIESLSEKIDYYHREEMKALDSIQMSLYLGTQLIEAGVSTEIASCNQLFNSIDEYQDILERKVTYVEAREYIADEYDVNQYKTDCLKGINKVINNRTEVHPLFYQYAVKDFNSKISMEGINNYNKIISFIKRNYSELDVDSYEELLPAAVGTYDSLDLVNLKFDHLKSDILYQKSFKNKFAGFDFVDQVQKLLSPDSILKYGHGVVDFVPYLSFINRSGELADLMDILEGNFSKSGIRAIKTLEKGLLPVVELAITQQNILRGEIIIPMMYKMIVEGKKGDAKYREVVNVLEKNRTLAVNFLKYYLAQNLKENNASVISYEIGLKSDKLDFLYSFIGNSFDVTTANSKKVVRLGTTELELPTGKAVSEQKLDFTYPLKGLLEFRSKIISEITDFKISNKMKKDKLGASYGTLIYFGSN